MAYERIGESHDPNQIEWYPIVTDEAFIGNRILGEQPL